MRIAVVEPVGRGGLIHYAFQLSRGLATAGADVTLVTDRKNEVDGLPRAFHLAPVVDLWDPKPEGPRPGSSGTLQRLGRGFLYLRQWSRLVAWLRRERFDIVQLGDIRFGAELPFVGRLHQQGSILADICHNVVPFATRRGSFRSRHLTRLVYRRIYRLFDVVFVHYGTNRERFLETYDLPEERVRAIPMGDGSLFAELRDPSRTPEALRRELELPDVPVILLFGTLSGYKGVDLLIESFATLPERHRNVHLVVAGYPLPGFDVDEQRGRAEDLGIGDRVRFVPRYLPSDEVAAWMELATVAAFPYREVFQSAAIRVPSTFGVPVIASDVGAMREATADREDAILVPPGDASALGDALLDVLDDHSATGASDRRNLDPAKTCSWETIGQMVVSQYRDLLGAGPRDSKAEEP